jgi:hypothetical protein
LVYGQKTQVEIETARFLNKNPAYLVRKLYYQLFTIFASASKFLGTVWQRQDHGPSRQSSNFKIASRCVTAATGIPRVAIYPKLRYVFFFSFLADHLAVLTQTEFFQYFVKTEDFKGLPSDIAGCVIPTATNTKPSVHVDVPATVLKSSAVNMLPDANAKQCVTAGKARPQSAAVTFPKKAKSVSDSVSDSSTKVDKSKIPADPSLVPIQNLKSE